MNFFIGKVDLELFLQLNITGAQKATHWKLVGLTYVDSRYF